MAYSTRNLAAALYLSQPAVSAGLSRLRDRQLRLLENVGGHRARVRSVYQVMDPAGTALPRSADVDSSKPLPLPRMLESETPTVKLVYVYLEPYREVEVSVRQLEALLSISHRPAAEAMQRLITLELLKVLERPANRLGKYRVG